MTRVFRWVKTEVNQSQKIRGQSVIEYAAIVGVVAAALIAMNVYVQRSTQTNLKAMERQITPESIANSTAGFGE